MTANDLRYNILLGVDSLFQGTAPGYNTKQMNSIINRAQRRVFRKYANLFDTNEKVKKMLAPVTRRGSISAGDITLAVDPQIIDYPHDTSALDASFYVLPTEVYRLTEEFAKLEIDNVVTDPVIVFPITYDYFTKNYNSRYKKPHSKLIWRMDVERENGDPVVELIFPNTHTINNYFIVYLRYPTDIVVNTVNPAGQIDCEIPDQSFQDELIGEAIKIITASLNDEGYQVATAEENFDNQ
jgi:hypothetical protein